MTENLEAPKDVKKTWEFALLQLTTFRAVRTVWDTLSNAEQQAMINLEIKLRFSIRRMGVSKGRPFS